jgi:hypothetical protein
VGQYLHAACLNSCFPGTRGLASPCSSPAGCGASRGYKKKTGFFFPICRLPFSATDGARLGQICVVYLRAQLSVTML